MNRYYCARCESDDIEALRPRYLAAIGVVLSGLGAWLLPIPLLGITFLASGVGLLILSPFTKKLYFCKKCRKFRKMKPPKENNIIEFPYH